MAKAARPIVVEIACKCYHIKYKIPLLQVLMSDTKGPPSANFGARFNAGGTRLGLPRRASRCSRCKSSVSEWRGLPHHRGRCGLELGQRTPHGKTSAVATGIEALSSALGDDDRQPAAHASWVLGSIRVFCFSPGQWHFCIYEAAMHCIHFIPV